MTTQDKKRAAGVRKWWLKTIVFLVLVGTILFLASGRPTWGMAWVYLSSLVVITIANAIAMDPDLLEERSQLQEGTKNWDVALASFVGVWGPLSIWLVAGLDIRFEWSQGMAQVLQIAALVLVVVGGLLGTWSMGSNRYFSATVRIQTDRSHGVVSQGPYRFLRHPGYAGGIISMLMTPIALGSWVALIPGVLVACGYIVRTSLEDKVLHEELERYQDYAMRVCYRLVPGVW